MRVDQALEFLSLRAVTDDHEMRRGMPGDDDAPAAQGLVEPLARHQAADPDDQIEAVREVLGEIGAGEVPELLVINKSDLAPTAVTELVGTHPGSVAVSAGEGTGLDDLLTVIGDRLRGLRSVVELRIPYERGDVVAALHRGGEVISEQALADVMVIRARLDDAHLSRVGEFVVGEDGESGVDAEVRA